MGFFTPPRIVWGPQGAIGRTECIGDSTSLSRMIDPHSVKWSSIVGLRRS